MNLGLKLWSINTDYYLEEAKKLYNEGWFDYIELYMVPGTINTIEKWKMLRTENGIPFTLHAPHFVHGVNLADVQKERFNIEVFKEVDKFREEMNAEYVVVHPGIEGNIDETLRQLDIIKPQKMLVENKPFVAPLYPDKECRGARIEEIKKVLENFDCGFCLDVGHALCTANSLKIPQYGYLKGFNSLNPDCYHLSGNYIDSEMDAHLHFNQGNYDLRKIFDIINTDKNIAIETNKNSKESLVDFVEDVTIIRGLSVERN